MFEKHVFCSKCGKIYPIKKPLFRCGCGGSLEVAFDYGKLRKSLTPEKLHKRPFNHARYRELYPVKELLSVQEGGTPLVRSRNLERMFSLKFRLYFKYEAQNPTGSFKDRGSSVEVGKALEFRARKVVCASTGNMGASVAAYSGLANLPCWIFTPRDAVKVKIEQILAYGARVYHVSGDYTRTARLVEEANRKHGLYLLGDYLYRREGTKSVGFEIAEQLPSVDYVFCPVGNGTLLSATWKAFQEFRTLGFTRKRPRMVGIQAFGCSPLVRAFRKGKDIEPVHGRTLAAAIECGSPLDGERALLAIKESGGFAEDVPDRDILRARELLAEREGLFAEPAGAAALAGILKHKDMAEKGSSVVCLVTGHGLKTPMTGVRGKPRNIKADPKVLGRIFAK